MQPTDHGEDAAARPWIPGGTTSRLDGLECLRCSETCVHDVLRHHKVSEGQHRHDRVMFVLDQGELRHRNMRKLGGVWLARGPAEVDELLSRLGADALDIGQQEFLELMGRRRGRIKTALMDQTFIAGVGNLLAGEALWAARIRPIRRIEGLSDDERMRRLRAPRAVTRRAVARIRRVSIPVGPARVDGQRRAVLDAEPSSPAPSSEAEERTSVRRARRET